MLSLNALAWNCANPLPRKPLNLSLRRLIITACSCTTTISAGNPDFSDSREQLSNRLSGYSGTHIEETVNLDSGKLRLDSWIVSQINGISRARVQSSIRSGLVFVNGNVVSKVSHVVRDGDMVHCTISELQPLRAEPEDIPLDIVFEDEHVLVVNKPAHMVVHPAPGNATGTLVNGILHHCRLSAASFLNPEAPYDDNDVSADEACDFSIGKACDGDVRPGIVHRLDKGTSGLLVVAKDEHSHAHLSGQFKEHSIKRVYVSLTCGVPSSTSGRIDIPIGRDVNNRIRMIALLGSGTRGNARHAVSRMVLLNLVCWNAILGAYAMHGKGKKALEIFASMQRSGQKPDSVSFAVLVSACTPSGVTEEGRYYFESMSVDHGIEARLEHYACVVSLLGHAGQLDEAYSIIKKMPFELDACV